jgi:hypothetical protein
MAAAVLLALGCVVFLEDDLRKRPSPFILEMQLATRDSGSAQVFFDRGDGFRQEDSSSATIEGSRERVVVRFPLSLGTVHRLRVDYLNGSDSTASLAALRIIDTSAARLVRTIPVSLLRPNDQIASYRIADDVLEVAARPGVDDPFLIANLEPALVLGPSPLERWLRRLIILLPLLAAFTGLAWVIDRLGDTSADCQAPMPWSRRFDMHPRWTLAAVAAVATVLCCHPVIFAGRSLVSPGYGLALMHPDHGTRSTPGLEHADDHGSDIGAMLWQHLPYSVVQHRALVDEGTLPLWNRFNSCGVDLFGQGQSMLGDPFHLPVILAGGAAWAWDAKFVVARFLFACGIGLAAFAATRRLGPSALVALSAPFIGFFSFRLNHPAAITVCYSPWVLVAWLELARTTQPRQAARLFVLLVAANGCLITSGTVKEAAMLFAALNIAGLLTVVVTVAERRHRARLLATTAALLVGGLMLTAPWWMAFLGAYRSAWTAYDTPYVLRIPLARLAGLFDGMLYSEFFPERFVYAPSANFVALFGVLLLVARWKRVWRDRVVVVLAAVLVVALSLAFDTPWMPDAWILAVPGLRSVGHVGNTFSCVALPLLLVLAARGFAAATEAPSMYRRAGFRDAVVVAMLACVLVVPMLWRLWEVWRTAGPDQSPWHTLAAHGYFLGALGAVFVGWAMLPVATSWMHDAQGRRGAGVVLLLAALLPALARHGQTLHRGHNEFFVRPALRTDLADPSTAVAWLKAREAEPFRVVGLSGHLVAGYAAVHGLESPNGPDALANRAYRELTQAAGLAPEADWYFSTEPDEVASHRRILDMLNVRYYANCPASPAAPPWVQARFDGDLAILESPGAWPRAFFVDRIVPCTTAAELVSMVAAGDGRPFAALQPADQRGGDRVDGNEGARVVVAATDYHLAANHTEFTVAAPGPGLVVLTEAWAPEAFTATIDGEPAEVVRVNHAFKGVRVDRAGVFRIVFRFGHPAPGLALALAATGALAMLAAVLWLGRQHPRAPLTGASGQSLPAEAAHS